MESGLQKVVNFIPCIRVLVCLEPAPATIPSPQPLVGVSPWPCLVLAYTHRARRILFSIPLQIHSPQLNILTVFHFYVDLTNPFSRSRAVPWPFFGFMGAVVP